MSGGAERKESVALEASTRTSNEAQMSMSFSGHRRELLRQFIVILVFYFNNYKLSFLLLNVSDTGFQFAVGIYNQFYSNCNKRLSTALKYAEKHNSMIGIQICKSNGEMTEV